MSKPFTRYREVLDQGVPWVRPEELAHVPLRGPVIACNGAFDLLHSGHMRLLFAAAKQGPTVVVGLDTDEKLRAEKGPGRPFLSFSERAAALNFMPVSLIVPISSREDMDLLMQWVDLRVQGDEYLGKPSRYPQIPKLLVRDTPMHTSELARRMKKGPRK